MIAMGELVNERDVSGQKSKGKPRYLPSVRFLNSSEFQCRWSDSIDSVCNSPFY